jgi:hypothetical protein
VSDSPLEPADDTPGAGAWPEVRPAQLALLHRLVFDVGSLDGGDPADAVRWERVRDAANRLAGTLGALGQQPAGDTAVTLDGLVSGTDGPDQVDREQLRALTVALHEALPHSAAECLNP